jgi:hypothetical protein
MKQKSLVFFIFVFIKTFSQSGGLLKQGDHAPSFILNLEGNSIKSYVMPYMKHIVMLHFWSSDVITSKIYGKRLNSIAKRYDNALYKNADGFEVVAIAVQANKKAWRNDIQADSLNEFTHGIALNGFNEDVCKKYSVVSLPTDILIDENGNVIAIDPKLTDVETILDDRKNFQPVKKDVTGTLALSSNKMDVLKFSRLYLFNHYGDSVGKTVTSATGGFVFSDVKLNQDFVLKVDNQTDIITSDPISLYTPTGELLLDGKTSEGGFVFNIPARLSYKLTESEHAAAAGVPLNIIKNLEFTANGGGLTAKDEKELNTVLSLLEGNHQATLEFTTNTDSKLTDAAALALTTKQAATLTRYFEKKGVDKTRLKSIPKGNDEPRVLCDQTHACTEEDHKENRRVEFFVHKN